MDNVNVLLQEVVRTRLEATRYSQSSRECRVVTISTLTHSSLHQVGYSQSRAPEHVLSDFPHLYKCIFICDLEDTILIDFDTLLFVIAWTSLLVKIIHWNLPRFGHTGLSPKILDLDPLGVIVSFNTYHRVPTT